MFNLLFPLWMVASLFLSFGAANDAKLAVLAAFFRWRMQVFLLLCKTVLGLDVVVVQTVRSAAQQAALHKADPRNPLLPGDHGAGRAADLNFWKGGKPYLVKASSAALWAPVYALAELCGISNGSQFTGYPDNNHFFRRSTF